MSKRYMDFVPASVARSSREADVSGREKETTARKSANPKVTKPAAKLVSSQRLKTTTTAKKEAVSAREAKSVEEFTWFDAAEGKSVITEEPVFGVIEDLHPKKDSSSGQDSEKKKPYNAIKKSPFVNTEKVTKRPLSKSVYQKKVVVPKEEPSKTVTIITKPEKDSKVGIVVAIILTIILGAAAGTVAFLLLPK